MGNPWTDLVKEKFRLGRKTSAEYSLKDAMIEAKKFYKKGAQSVTGKRRSAPASKGKRRKTNRRGRSRRVRR